MTPRAAELICNAAEALADDQITDRKQAASQMSDADKAAHDAATYVRTTREG